MPEMAVIKFRAKRGVYADTRGEFPIPWVYPTIQEAIEREVLPALGGYAEDFDVRAIADDVFEYVTPEDDRGRARVDRAGFVLKVGVLEFWEVAFSHELGVES